MSIPNQRFLQEMLSSAPSGIICKRDSCFLAGWSHSYAKRCFRAHPTSEMRFKQGAVLKHVSRLKQFIQIKTVGRNVLGQSETCFKFWNVLFQSPFPPPNLPRVRLLPFHRQSSSLAPSFSLQPPLAALPKRHFRPLCQAFSPPFSGGGGNGWWGGGSCSKRGGGWDLRMAMNLDDWSLYNVHSTLYICRLSSYHILCFKVDVGCSILNVCRLSSNPLF